MISTLLKVTERPPEPFFNPAPSFFYRWLLRVQIYVCMDNFRIHGDASDLSTLLSRLVTSQQGFELVPLVIAVGDYVLTPEICVERKSLSDLFQSMSSGRLYNQVGSR